VNTIQYILSPREAYIAQQQWRIVKRSVDARQRELKVHLTVLVDESGKPISKDAPIPLYAPPVFQDVHHAEREAIIIGCGPAGLFAALTLIEQGIRPIIYERGKEVSERKKDIALLNRNEGLKSMYKADDDNMAVLYITNATARFCSFAAPDRKVNF
jgi:uncharacterized FAD-dependent dehydrogenase